MKTQEKSKHQNLTQSPWNGLPLTARRSTSEAPLYWGLFFSVISHLAVFLLIVTTIFILKFFNIRLEIFPKQKMPLQDIQFVLDKPKQKLIAPKKSTPQNASAKNETQIKKSASVPTKKIKKKSFLPKFSPLKKPSIIPNKKSVAIPAKSGKATKSPKSTSASKPRSNTAAIPDFSMDMPKLKSISSGLSGSGTPKKHASGFDVSSSSINSGGTSNQWDSSSGGGSSTKTAKKIITTYDISPYVNELKRDIKANWSKPAQSKRVELFLRIAKDGRLIILNVKRTSDNGDIDNAALNAVKKCLPLNPLPAKYNKSYLDVIFVFDSNTITSR